VVNIVVLSLNRIDKTMKCLDGIGENVGKDTPYYITIIDNGSSAKTRSMLYRYAKSNNKIKLHLFPTNVGCGFARCAAVVMNDADFILNLDNDIVITSGCVESLLRTIGISSFIMGVCATVVEEGHPDLRGAIIRDNNICYISDDEQCDVDIVHGGATLWRKEAFDLASCQYYCMEDWFFSMDIKKLGFRLLNCPEAVVHHFPNRKFSGIKDDINYANVRRNECMIQYLQNRFFNKWGLNPKTLRLPLQEKVEIKQVESEHKPIRVVQESCSNKDSSLIHIVRKPKR
jgi:GT2 family glycosyltransferase